MAGLVEAIPVGAEENLGMSDTYRDGLAEGRSTAIGSRVFIFSELIASAGKCREIREG